LAEYLPTIITSNKAYKQWPEIFNNDSTLTAALLDRLLHHAETLVIEGSVLPHARAARRLI
jgi:DNA replication protein DnaC